MLKSIAKILIFVSSFFVFNPLFAKSVETLYDVDILVADESTEARNQAFNQGLDEIFIRISGDSIVMDSLKRPTASRYVKQFSYEPVAELESDADSEEEPLTHILKLQYSGHAMEKYLLENGFPVWGRYRPDVVVWVVVRDGKNEYVLKNNDRSLVKTAIDKDLTRRGIPVSWPSYDAKDKKILSVADIRGGFKGPVIDASTRYSKGPALTGSIIWNGKQWQSSWGLMANQEDRHWSVDAADYNHLIENAIDQAGDLLGSIYAIHHNAGDQQFITIQVEVQSVSSIEKYRYIENYLANLNIVEHSRPLKIDAHTAAFEVTLSSTEDDFLNMIKSDAAFSEIKIPVTQNVAPVEVKAVAPIEAISKENTSDDAISIEKKTDDIVSPVAVEEAPVKQIPIYRYKLMK
jgi:hypothetical protein